MDGIMTPANDAFSFGVILTELWTGKRAWEDVSLATVVFSVTIKGQLLKLPAEAPAAYAALAHQCMAVNKEDRPEFPEIVQRIEEMLQQELPGN